MRTRLRFLAVIMVGAASVVASADPVKPSALSEKDIADGWISLFDGESTFGWKVDGDAIVKDGKLIVGGPKATTLTSTAQFHAGKLRFEYVTSNEENAKGGGVTGPDNFAISFASGIGAKGQRNFGDPQSAAAPLVIATPAGQQIVFTTLSLLPTNSTKLFNGKDLTGWKVYTEEPAKNKATFTVTPTGELHVLGGPGDIRTEKNYADFVLQTEVKTAGPTVNSGIFFRSVPGQYQNGYECQVQNAMKDSDRSKPADYGTGAIYRRIAARKVVPSDNEWFTLTLVANGPHFSTWVNGYQVVDWTDERPRDENPRKGLRTDAGHLSIQGHNPPMSADVLFRNIRIAELKAAKK